MTTDPWLPLALPPASSASAAQSPGSGPPTPISAGNTPREPGTRSATERLSRRGLERLSAALSPRDWAVLQAVAGHRFLTTKHLERLLFTDHASTASAARTCRRVTAQLASHHVLRAVERRIGGIRAGSAAAVWTTGAVGRRLLARSPDGPVRRHAEPSERFLGHALAIADTHLALVEADRRGDVELLSVELEPTCWRPFLTAAGSRAVLQPDLGVTTGAGAYEDAWFIEVDLGNEHVPTLLRKCQQYLSYRQTGAEQQQHGSFPWVIWLLSTERRVEQLRAAMTATRSLDGQLFRVCTPAGLLGELTSNNTKGGDQ